MPLETHTGAFGSDQIKDLLSTRSDFFEGVVNVLEVRTYKWVTIDQMIG